MLATLKKAACVGAAYRTTPRDTLISAMVLLGGTLVMSAAGIALGRWGYPVLGVAVKSLAFPISMTASLPFSYLRAQPTRVQFAVTGTTLLILVWATYLASLI